MNKLVVFDLDGTLIDTIKGITIALNNTLTYFNYPYKYSEKEVQSFIGHGARYLYQKATKKNDIDEEEFSYYQIEYIKRQNVSVVYNDVIDTLIYLDNIGYKLGIYSNKPIEALKSLIKDKLNNINFSFVLGNNKKYLPKPDVTLLKEILIKLNLINYELYYVGDSIVDILTCRNLNMKSIILTSGYGNKEEIINNKPDYIIDKFKDILKIL